MISNFLSICSFVIRHPGLLLVLLGVSGEVAFDWPETHGPLAWARRLSSAVLVIGLVVEFFEAAKSDKEVASLTLKTATAQKQIAEISLDVAKANKAAAEAREQTSVVEKQAAQLQKDANEARLELERLKIAQMPRTMSAEQRDIILQHLSNARKRPVRVISCSPKEEAVDWAKQIRECLDFAGFSDAANPIVTVVIGISVSTRDKATTLVAWNNEEECRADFTPGNNFSNVQNALRHAGIMAGAIVSELVKPGDMAVMVVDK
ncbi:MAG: hypothetical protein NTV08_11235 [Verrucomicrobia bacterium]|nr:hypothetical protein [Verrucomicrobiota bacterium]